MPMTKSYHGSIGISRFLFRKTWKPDVPCRSREFGEVPSESSRDMNRFNAPNILLEPGVVTYSLRFLLGKVG